jgi:hypothetical protein
LYLESSSGFQGSNERGSADGFPDPHPDVTETFATTWLTLRENRYYGTVVYMDPREYPAAKTWPLSSESGISPAFASNGARLNQDDIEKLPFKAWVGTVYSNLAKIKVSAPMKQSSKKEKIVADTTR